MRPPGLFPACAGMMALDGRRSAQAGGRQGAPLFDAEGAVELGEVFGELGHRVEPDPISGIDGWDGLFSMGVVIAAWVGREVDQCHRLFVSAFRERIRQWRAGVPGVRRYPLRTMQMPERCVIDAGEHRGRNVADERRSIEIAQSYVKNEDRSHMRRNASRAVAIKAIRNAKSLWRAQQYAIAARQVWEASRTSLAPGVLIRLAQLLAWIMYHAMSAPRPPSAAHASLQSTDGALDRGPSRG